MLLGTHPIPARSPAEREGQIRKEMRRGGGDRSRRGTGSVWVENGDQWMG